MPNTKKVHPVNRIAKNLKQLAKLHKVHRNGKPFTKKRPGVCAVIVALLESASKTKPITKEKIVATLARKFPDRDADKMARTVRAAPVWLRVEQGIVVHKNAKGYWIA